LKAHSSAPFVFAAIGFSYNLKNRNSDKLSHWFRQKKEQVMKKAVLDVSTLTLILCFLLAACSPAPAPAAIEDTAAPLQDTSRPESVDTEAPSPTALPGVETVPLDSLEASIPWLTMDNSKRPVSYYFLFNLSKPPFTNVLVRQAFAMAVERQALVNLAAEGGFLDPRPATTFTPPETLGRDLFNAVGVGFRPTDARQLLSEAGYTDLSTFPEITLMTNPGQDGRNERIAQELVRQWEIYLGITVNLEVVSQGYFDRVASDPTEIFFSIWAADYNDPEGFLLENFRTGTQYNYNHFSNAEFDALVDQAGDAAGDPPTRQALYIEAERLLCEVEVALIPIFHTTADIQ
jgi:ABC-type oligopeptide transport system substrate-binding subunit